MSSNIKMSTAARNALLDSITTYAGGSAKLRIYSGTQPTDANTAIGAQVLLSTLICNATFAPAASGGVLTLNAISNDTDAAATGTATWFRLLKSDGTTVVLDGTVGTSGADLNLNTTSIVQHATVSVTSATITAPNA